MKTARYDETHSPGARHAAAWVGDIGRSGLKGADVMTLAVVGCLADAALFTAAGYSGISATMVGFATGVSGAAAERRLETLVRAGALEKRQVVKGLVHYWIPEEVRLP